MSRRNSLSHTDAGELPVDWQVKSLREVTDFTNGKPHEADIKADGRFSLVTLDSVDIRGQLKGTHRAIDVWDDSLRAGDVVSVLSDLAHGLLLGMSAVIPADNAYVLNQRMGRLRLKVPGSPAYLRLQINRRQEHFRKRGQGTSQRHIYKRDFDALEIPFPEVAEQGAIAEAIADADALLAGLDRLIAKKRDLKQAAMQQLLTGQTRLPGFHGEWEEKRLGEVAEMGSGGTPLSSVPAFYGGSIPWVSIADMTGAGRVIEVTEKTLTPLGLENSAAQLFSAGTVLYAMYASLGECCIAGVPVTTSQAILGIRPNQPLIGEFLYYFLSSMKAKVKTLGQQGTQANLNKGIVQDFRIALPSREEQETIVGVLSDMDAELTALEARRDKTRALKQGMMQELLTGRTRLV